MKTIAITNVNVITMVNDDILTNKTILIENGKITFVGDPLKINKYEAFIINGKNKYILPSLIDMHVHLGDNKDDLLLYLVNGITTIRNMWGYEGFRFRNWLFGTRVFNHLKLKEKINNGSIPGPQIFSAGHIIEGENPFFPRFMIKKVTSKIEAEEIVQKQVNNGYDLIKFYSTISENVFNTLVYTAKKNDISIAGHVPDEVGIRKVVKAGVTSIEHLLGFFNPYNPQLAIKKNEIPEIAQLSAENNVYHCPTLIASERICNIDALEQYQNEPEMKYLPHRIKKGMKFLLMASSKLFKSKKLKPNHEYLPFLFTIIEELKKQGAQILLGTDKATPYVIAGFSIHRELNLLHKAGLTPFEAIKAGTVNAASCLGIEDQVGTIEVGKSANLLLVEENPLEKLITIKDHCGVMNRGNWLSREKCDEILNKLKYKNNK